MDNNKKIVGCSFDGLKDRFFVHGNNSPHGTDFYLADVVLPKHYGGRFLTGDEAERNRVSSGFHWPPEAQVNVDSHLRRIPVSWAWRLLIDAEEKYGSQYTRWDIGGGVSFNISKILTAHIVDKLGSENKNADEIVIAIPNDLDEFRQDELIKDLILQGIGSRKEKPHLLWRPIAAALAWLDKVQVPENISNEDFILIVHIGPDSVEFVTLRLREIVHDDKRYVVPVRETPHNKYSLCGCDWAAEFIGQEFDTNEPDEIWQCFTNFPETWKTLAQQPWNTEELPRVWSRGDSWELWQPEENCQERIWQLEAKYSSCLDTLTRENYKHKRTDSTFDSWKTFLQRGIIKALDNCENGNLCGMILSGPLTSANPIVWLQGIKEKLESRGLSVNIFDKARFNGVWAPCFNEDIISEGASIYGTRISRNEPTYLDIVPQLYTWAEKSGIADWEPLLKTKDRGMQDEIEIAGNIPLEVEHARCFSLKRDKKKLEVFLRKGDSNVFKKTIFSFPYAPQEDMPLNIKIRVASANGLAQLELIPENREFLGGQRVFMDYSRMEDTKKLPALGKYGYPEVTGHEIDHNDYKILRSRFRNICETFLSTNIYEPAYRMIVAELGEKIRTGSRIRNNEGNWISVRIVDKDGNAGTNEGQSVINKVSKKLGVDLDKMLLDGIDRNSTNKYVFGRIFNASTWLFGAVPLEVLCYLRKKLDVEELAKRNIVEAAGRCLKEESDLALFFKAAIRKVHDIDRINYERGIVSPFPIQWTRAIWRVLYLREHAPDAMERNDAGLFAKCIMRNMEICVNKENYSMTFMQSVRMFLYLLRFRRKEQDFLSYTTPSYKKLFKDIINCLEKAQEYFKGGGRRHVAQNNRAAEYMKEIEKYINYEGGDILRLERELFPEEENE